MMYEAKRRQKRKKSRQSGQLEILRKLPKVTLNKFCPANCSIWSDVYKGNPEHLVTPANAGVQPVDFSG